MPENNSKPGRKPRVTDNDILEVFQDTPDPVLSTSEVAEKIPIKRRGTLNRLQSLEERDVLESKRIGGRNTVWWLSPSAGARMATDSMRDVSQPSHDTPGKDRSRPLPNSDSRESHQNGRYADVSFPQTKDRDDCIEAIDAVVSYLEENGPAQMSEIVQDVMPEYPAGYDAESDVKRIQDPDRRNRSTWWRKVIKPGLEAHDDVLEPPEGGSKWRIE